MTFNDYFARFVYDQDYAAADEVIEFHFTGFDPQFEGMDWKSLRIVLVKKEDQWFVAGIIHDEWTI
jgi:hypothetical protein